MDIQSDIPIRHYCEDCNHRTGSKSYGYCSHENLRQEPAFDYRQKDSERYPLCSLANRMGLCKLYEIRRPTLFERLLRRL
jgi:hypothetical protein